MARTDAHVRPEVTHPTFFTDDPENMTIWYGRDGVLRHFARNCGRCAACRHQAAKHRSKIRADRQAVRVALKNLEAWL